MLTRCRRIMAATYRLYVTDERTLDGAHHSDLIREMISDADIWQAALAMMKRYRTDAMLEAAARADEYTEAGDWEGANTWHRILDAIERPQAKEPADGEKVH
jgi:hypothetical protein